MSGHQHDRICLGAFAGAFGVKGEAKIKSFTDAPANIAVYGPVETEDGARRFTLTVVREMKDGLVIARAPEIDSREDAQSLRGVRLYVAREKLPDLGDDEFYLEDLVGLDAVDENGAGLGHVSAVYNFGAGDIIELSDIPGVDGVRLAPFTQPLVPTVDIEGGRVVVLRAALEHDDALNDPVAEETFIDAAMREEDS